MADQPPAAPPVWAPLTTRLTDGTVGYYMHPHRGDQCLEAAVATVLQVPLWDVPDSRLDERLRAGDETADQIAAQSWLELVAWLDARGLDVIVYDKPAVELERWIGVVVSSLDRPFMSHCLVMARDAILFDPSANVPHAFTGRVWHFEPEWVRWGIAFQPKES